MNIYVKKDGYYIGFTRKMEMFYFDEKDFDLISKYNWYKGKRGYMVTGIKRRPVVMHKFLFSGKLEIDHIDCNKLNNRRNNLRQVTHQQNMFNQPKRKNCSSKYKGVSWSKGMKKWECYIDPNGKRIRLGYYEDEIEAAKKYDEAALLYFGEFARPNFEQSVVMSK
jgi:hypothetical protein